MKAAAEVWSNRNLTVDIVCTCHRMPSLQYGQVLFIVKCAQLQTSRPHTCVQDDGPSDAETRVAELCALLEQAGHMS